MKPKYHYCHTWQMNFDFFIGWKWGDFEKYCKKHFKFDVPEFSHQGGYTTLIVNRDRARVLIWISTKNRPSIAAHEALHAVNFVQSRAGYSVRDTNDEAQAYFLTEIMQAMGYK